MNILYDSLNLLKVLFFKETVIDRRFLEGIAEECRKRAAADRVFNIVLVAEQILYYLPDKDLRAAACANRLLNQLATAEMISRINKTAFFKELGFSTPNASFEFFKASGVHIKKLSFSSCDYFSFPGITEISDSELAVIYNSCPDLTFIDLGSSTVTDGGVEGLVKNCRSLKQIDLHNSRITDLALFAIGENCSGLHSLNVNGCAISDEGVEFIARRCANLKSLYIDSEKLTQRSLIAISEGCREIELLSLNDNRTTDAGLFALSRCRKLRLLELSFCKNATIEGAVQVLRNCRHLKLIDLQGCGFGKEALKALALNFPNTAVVAEPFSFSLKNGVMLQHGLFPEIVYTEGDSTPDCDPNPQPGALENDKIF